MLWSVVSASATNMMLVRCNSDVPISWACLRDVSDSPDRGIIGTTSLRDLEDLRSSRKRVDMPDCSRLNLEPFLAPDQIIH